MKDIELETLTFPLTVWIEDSAVGDSEPICCETLNQASAAFRAFTEANGFGASKAGRCVIRNGFHPGSEVVAHVSYNGRVWAGSARDWNSKTELLLEARR